VFVHALKCVRPGNVGVPPSLRTPPSPSMQAVSIPDFSVVMAFIGSVPSNIMAFFLPALFHLIICWRVIGFWGRFAYMSARMWVVSESCFRLISYLFLVQVTLIHMLHLAAAYLTYSLHLTP
jgi:hypothetical protein